MNWRTPARIGGAAIVILLVAVGAYLLGARRQAAQQPHNNSTAIPSSAQIPVQVVSLPPSGAPSIPDITPAILKAVTGDAPALVSLDSSSPQYTNATIGLTLRFPSNWKYAEAPQQSGVTFYPSGSDPNVPSPLIELDFAPQRPYKVEPSPSTYTTQPQPITVAGITGRQYEDSAYAIPTQGWYIELPYRNGTLLITATKGPSVNLVPQLKEILKTIELKP